MVYRGKPSTGCLKCRQRKIKCDERPGSCVKCLDKGFVCPGYDNSVDRYFQDESASVQAKAEKSKAKAIALRDERDRAERARRALDKMQDAIGVPLLCPLIDQGIAFFMGNYAMGLDQPPMQSDSYNRYLSTHGFHPIIATSMTALGLAGVANICMDGGLKREALRWYSNALKMTNKALASSTEVKSDNTLLATMLLSVFEATNNDRSLMGWTNHVSGSASLLRMRGSGQFATPAGRRMYMQTVGLLTMKCMGMGLSLPDFVHELNMEVEKWEDKNDPANRFYHLHIQVIDFRAQIIHRQITSLPTIIDIALKIDAGAKAIFDGVNEDWRYETEYCDEGTPGIFGTCYHVYPHLAAAQTWNWVRYNRIYLHDIIRNTLIAGFATSPPVFVGSKYSRLLEESTETLYQMQSEILASIPQYLHDTPKVPTSYLPMSYLTTSQKYFSFAPTSTREGLSSPSTGSSPTSQTSTPSTTPDGSPKLLTNNFVKDYSKRPDWQLPATPRDRLPIIRVSGGYSSLWALYVAGATPVATPESQEYVLRSFERVGGEFGINQAKVLASALRIKIELDRGETRIFEEEESPREGKNPWGEQRADVRRGDANIVPVYMPTVGPHVED